MGAEPSETPLVFLPHWLSRTGVAPSLLECPPRRSPRFGHSCTLRAVTRTGLCIALMFLACESNSSALEQGPVVDCARFSNGPTVGPGEPGPLGFPEVSCHPDADSSTDSSYYRCCSDDPAASGLANANSPTGMCVHVDDIPVGSGLAPLNCPTACNPQWDAAELEATCGSGRICCQTLALAPEDCAQDVNSNTWHAMTSEEAGHIVAAERGFCLDLGGGQTCPGQGGPNTCDRISNGQVDPPE